MTLRARCASCSRSVTEHPFVAEGGRTFCDEKCHTAWLQAEVARLRVWLTRITCRTRGVGAGLALRALRNEPL